MKTSRIGLVFNPLAPILNACEAGSFDLMNFVDFPSYSTVSVGFVVSKDSAEPSSLILHAFLTFSIFLSSVAMIALPPFFLIIPRIFLRSFSSSLSASSMVIPM